MPIANCEGQSQCLEALRLILGRSSWLLLGSRFMPLLQSSVERTDYAAQLASITALIIVLEASAGIGLGFGNLLAGHFFCNNALAFRGIFIPLGCRH
jgi:hypothetical protein